MDSQKTVKDQLTAYLKDAVRAVQTENIETVEAIGSKETTNAVCCVMEAIFLHGLKGSNTNKNFWPLVKKFTHKATVSQVTELGQISSDIGRCRAWIRIAINDGAIDSYCKLIIDDNSTLKHYYDSSSFFRDVEQCNAMQTHLQGLCNFVFNLAFNSTVLNQWTTATLVLAGLTTSGHLDWPTAFASSEALTGRSALEVSFQRRPLHSPSPASLASRLTKSPSCPQDLSEAFDSCLQLSQSEIDAIRDMSSALRDGSETPVSVQSKPDFTENRPPIYNRLTYGISSDSDERGSVDAERTDEQRDLRFERIVRTNLDRYPLDYDRNAVGSAPSGGGVGRVSDSNYEIDNGVLTKLSNGVDNVLNSVSLEDEKQQPTPAIVINEALPESKPCNPFDEDPPVASEDNLSKELLTADETLGNDVSGNAGLSSENGEVPTEEASVNSNLIRKKCTNENRHLRNAGNFESSYTTEELGVASDVILRVRPSGMLRTANGVPDLCGPGSTSDDAYVPQRRTESFNSLLKTYIPTVPQTKMRSLDDIIDELPRMEESGETAREDNSSSDWASTDTVSGTYDSSFDEKFNQQSQFLYQISIEKGLSEQCYQCRNCARAIGMFYGQDRVCAYDGFHYCHECHENKEHWIPAKVVFNWDFRLYKVSNLSFDYLQRISEAPCLNIERLNIKLYMHVRPLDTVLNLRTQLRYIKSYMLTCTQDVAVAFMERFDNQPYLFENIHLYSLKDLSIVPSGLLQKRLQKIVKFATSHVYNCLRCGMKGFYCEICRAAKVIYPFELSSTYRCAQCKAVYHSQCKTHLVPCPKCKRFTERENSLRKANHDPIDSVDYSYRRDNGTKDVVT